MTYEQGKQEIETWIQNHPFTKPSHEEQQFLSDGFESGDFSASHLMHACIFAYHMAEIACQANVDLRQEIKLEKYGELSLNDTYANFADDEDLDGTNTMLTEDTGKLNDPKVVHDPRHNRTVAAWGKIYHRALDQNAILRHEKHFIYLANRAQGWFHGPDRHKDREGKQSTLFQDPGYTDRILKKAAVTGKNETEETRRKLSGHVAASQRQFPDEIRRPGLAAIFEHNPRPTPDLRMMSENAIMGYDLPRRRADGAQRWDNFARSLAILAWENQMLQAAYEQVNRDLRDAQSRAATRARREEQQRSGGSRRRRR